MHKRLTSVFFVRMKRLIPKVNHFKLLLEKFSRVHSNALKTSPDSLVRIIELEFQTLPESQNICKILTLEEIDD